jgi:sulfite oxidase
VNSTNHKKHIDFVIKQESPFNAGPPTKLLSGQYITPTDLFFVRSHGDVPEVDLVSYRLKVDGKVSKTLSLSLDELKNNFARVEVSATLQCAGNRREELIAVRPIPNELPWNLEAISNATWAGIRLGDVLAAASVKSDSTLPLHV